MTPPFMLLNIKIFETVTHYYFLNMQHLKYETGLYFSHFKGCDLFKPPKFGHSVHTWIHYQLYLKDCLCYIVM